MVVVKELVEDNKQIAEDVRTMNVLKDIGNSIYKCVQYTVDCPTFHPSGMVPILDWQVCIVNNWIIQRFFEKPVA